MPDIETLKLDLFYKKDEASEIMDKIFQMEVLLKVCRDEMAELEKQIKEYETH